MMYPLVQDLAAKGFPVRLTCGCRLLHQAFYKWQANPICNADFDDAHLVNAIIDIHSDDPEFGYRFISDELERSGHEVGEGRVQRLCREHKIWSTTTKKGRRSSGKTPVRPSTTIWSTGTSAPRPPTSLADRHHRTSDERRQALRLLHQGRLLEPDRRLLDRRADDGGSGHGCSPLGSGPAPTSRHGDRPLRQGRPVSFSKIPSSPQGQRP